MYRNSFITATILYLVIFTILMPLQASEINKTFSKKESIQIKAVLGSCNVIKSNDDMIHVTLKYSFKEEEFHAKFSENSNVLSLEEEFIVKKPNGSSLWTIAIPDNIKIIFNSSTGNFNVEGVESEFTCNTGTGSITIQDGEGNFNISTGMGSIDVKKSTGKYDLNTGMGSINISDLKIEGDSKFSSGTGGVNILFSTSPEFNVTASSGTGEIILNYNGNPLKGLFEFTAKHDQGRIVSPVKYDKEETYSDNHVQYDKKTFRIDGQNTPKIKIDTGSGLAKLIK